MIFFFAVLGFGALLAFLVAGKVLEAAIRRVFGKSARIPPFRSLLAACLTLSGALIWLSALGAEWLFKWGGCNYGLKRPAECTVIPDGLGQAAFTAQIFLTPTVVFLGPLAVIAILIIEFRTRRQPR